MVSKDQVLAAEERGENEKLFEVSTALVSE